MSPATAVPPLLGPLLAADVDATVRSGALPVAVLVALAAGLVSFASPCVLPLVPGFLGYVTGLTGEPLVQRRRGRLVTGALLFVAGFTAVFVTLLAAAASALGLLVREHQGLLTRVGGVVVIVLALVFLGWGPQPNAALRWRPAAGLAGAPLLGVVFGLSMTPCIGPTFGAILTLLVPLSDGTAGVHRGVALATAYSLGLGVPFLLVATGWSQATRLSGWLRRHHLGVQRFGGLMLLAVGALMVSGLWDAVMAGVQARLVAGFETVL